MKEYRLGVYEKAMPNSLTLEEKLDTAKKCGFDYVELSIDESNEKLARLDMSTEERMEICAAELRLGISFESICLSGHRKYPLGSKEEATRERGMEIMQKAILLAYDLGIRTIQIAGYDAYYEPSDFETKALFEENLIKSVEFAAEYGVMLAFETMETEFIDTVEKAMRWVNKINSPYLCVYPDSGNITNAACRYNTNVVADLHTGLGRIAAVHLKESVPGKYREIPYGTGHVDFKSIIAECYAQGVRKYLAEFWYLGEEDCTVELKKANSFLRACFNEVLSR